MSRTTGSFPQRPNTMRSFYGREGCGLRSSGEGTNLFGPQILQAAVVDPWLEALQQADAIVGIQLLATLGGLTLTAATFLLAGPLTNLPTELSDINTKSEETGQNARKAYRGEGQKGEADEAENKAKEVYLKRQRKLETEISELEDGGTYLFWAFFRIPQ